MSRLSDEQLMEVFAANQYPNVGSQIDALRAVANAAAQSEREACAKLAENMYRRDLVLFAPEFAAADDIAREIRARGEN